MNATRRALINAGSIKPAARAVTGLHIDIRAIAARRAEARVITRAERDATERGWFEQQVCREAP